MHSAHYKMKLMYKLHSASLKQLRTDHSYILGNDIVTIPLENSISTINAYKASHKSTLSWYIPSHLIALNTIQKRTVGVKKCKSVPPYCN